jgi:hypothetical protein
MYGLTQFKTIFCRILPIFGLILLFFTPLSIFAQKKGNPYRSSVKGEEPLALRISGLWYNTYYGGKIGVDYPIKIVESRQLQGSLFGGRTFKEWYASLDASLLHIPNFDEKQVKGFELATLSAELTHRRMSGNGYFLQGSIGIGGSYIIPAFVADSTYAQSNFDYQNDWFLTPTAGVALGKDFAVGGRYRRGFPLVMMLRGNFSYILALPKFNRRYLAPTLELAFAYRFAAWEVATRHVRRN